MVSQRVRQDWATEQQQQALLSDTTRSFGVWLKTGKRPGHQEQVLCECRLWVRLPRSAFSSRPKTGPGALVCSFPLKKIFGV